MAAKKSRTELQPVGDRLVVKMTEAEDKTSSGRLYIPSAAKEQPQIGEIVAAGEGSRTANGVLIPMRVKVGDRVLFGKFSGSKVTVDGQPLLIVKESDILAVVVES